MRSAAAGLTLLLSACGGDGVGTDSVPVAATAIAVAAPGATGVRYAAPLRTPPPRGREAPDPQATPPIPPSPFAVPLDDEEDAGTPKPPPVPPPPSKKGTHL